MCIEFVVIEVRDEARPFQRVRMALTFCLGSGRKTYKALEVMHCTEIALLQGLTLRVRLLINKQIKQTDMHMHSLGHKHLIPLVTQSLCFCES